MVKIDEETFTTEFVVPLLRKLGFKRIRYVHGIDEFGRDVVFFDIDRFGMPIVCGCQVKVGSIKGSQKKKIQNEIIPQLLEGIRTPYKDPETGDIYRIQRMYLIISGSLAGTAKEQIHSLTANEPNICALDLQSLDLLTGGDGHETYFMYTTPGSDTSYPAGLKFVPRLPLMHKGMLLSIGMDLGDNGGADFLEITEVSYDPILREQLVTIELPVNDAVEELSDQVRNLATKELENWFDSIGAFLTDIIEDELTRPKRPRDG